MKTRASVIVLAKGVYFSLALVILYRFFFVDSANQGLIAGLLFFWLGFPSSFVSTYGIVLPMLFIDAISGKALSALPDWFQISFIVLICFANFCMGYYQWFVLVPRYVNRFIEVRLRKP